MVSLLQNVTVSAMLFSSTVNVCPVCCVWVVDGLEDAAERFTRMVFTEFFVREEIFVRGDFKWLQRMAVMNFATSTILNQTENSGICVI